jgi:hypothetical protein
MPLLSDISMAVSFVFSLFAVREVKYHKWGTDCIKKTFKNPSNCQSQVSGAISSLRYQVLFQNNWQKDIPSLTESVT